MRILSLILSTLLLTSCMTEASQKPQADKMVIQFNQDLQQQQWEDASAMFSPEFFKQTPKHYWQQQMRAIIQEKGPITHFNIVAQQKDPRFGGDFYIYMFSVIHTHGSSRETITIVQPVDQDKPMRITGFQFK